ncbi:low-density lipoprotein receptor-like [Anneissia japonica]|uniref:low-density lipoprotein receptor-like n=1 Tax=Anneissia japonica TaxID=1529436 RepID=UPI0014258007|nr:low-density lipoprotein receptor-like [Anneissia japonica]
MPILGYYLWHLIFFYITAIEKCSQSVGYFCEREQKCIPYSYLCDGLVDCDTGVDEFATTCLVAAKTTLAPSVCTVDQFQCDGERCIHISWWCDNFIDCKDTTDEQNCGETSGSGSLDSCSTNQFQCQYTYGCINSQYRCDGNTDCVDGSDETNCGENDICSGIIVFHYSSMICVCLSIIN